MAETRVDIIIKKGFQLRLWDDRYGLGIWAAIGREYDSIFIDVCELSSSADIEACSFNEYTSNDGAWLPFVVGSSALEAIEKLELKLAKLPLEQLSNNSVWSNRMDEALESLKEHSDGEYGIALAIDANKLPKEPNYL